jgi:NADPH:quinone reductase-like Zn-dependent oxidoreductase
MLSLDNMLILTTFICSVAAKKNQKYYFLFVESNGKQLERISEIFEEKNIKPSVDTVFELSDINKALDKVDKGGSKGKTLIKIGE